MTERDINVLIKYIDLVTLNVQDIQTLSVETIIKNMDYSYTVHNWKIIYYHTFTYNKWLDILDVLEEDGEHVCINQKIYGEIEYFRKLTNIEKTDSNEWEGDIEALEIDDIIEVLQGCNGNKEVKISIKTILSIRSIYKQRRSKSAMK